MSIGDLTRTPLMRSADLQQAEYFHALLSHQRSELCKRLDNQRAALARYEHVGDVSGVRRKRRIITTLESELRMIDQMNKALGMRLASLMRP